MKSYSIRWLNYTKAEKGSHTVKTAGYELIISSYLIMTIKKNVELSDFKKAWNTRVKSPLDVCNRITSVRGSIKTVIYIHRWYYVIHVHEIMMEMSQLNLCSVSHLYHPGTMLLNMIILVLITLHADDDQENQHIMLPVFRELRAWSDDLCTYF